MGPLARLKGVWHEDTLSNAAGIERVIAASWVEKPPEGVAHAILFVAEETEAKAQAVVEEALAALGSVKAPAGLDQVVHTIQVGPSPA